MSLFDRMRKSVADSVSDVVDQSGISDVLKTGEYKQRIAELEQEVASLKGQMSPDLIEAAEAHARSERMAKLESGVRRDLDRLNKEVEEKKRFLIDFDDELMFQEFGLYKPRFDFQTVDEYKATMKQLRDSEKEWIKRANDKAKKTNWTVNNSKAEGRKMVSDITRLIYRAFNGECDEIVRKVKFSNVDKSLETIDKVTATVSKLGRVINLSIPDGYAALKKEEVRVAFEFAQFKEREKEHARELREQQREEAKLAKEIAEQRKKLEKERLQYQHELDNVLSQINAAKPEELDALNAKRAELEANLGEVAKAKADVDYREANQRAGYVYVISNIGSFGKDVYKIGMTRRLDPMERVRELGDASVPFNFDVHALIFSDDAPALEAALHRRFEDEKVNKVNSRREFFHASLDEIKRVVKENYDKTVEFTNIPDAEQYRISKKMEEQANGAAHCRAKHFG